MEIRAMSIIRFDPTVTRPLEGQFDELYAQVKPGDFVEFVKNGANAALVPRVIEDVKRLGGTVVLLKLTADGHREL
jgi:hypothetical protein